MRQAFFTPRALTYEKATVVPTKSESKNVRKSKKTLGEWIRLGGSGGGKAVMFVEQFYKL
jgi:hypothetical protein